MTPSTISTDFYAGCHPYWPLDTLYYLYIAHGFSSKQEHAQVFNRKRSALFSSMLLEEYNFLNKDTSLKAETLQLNNLIDFKYLSP